MRKDNFKVLKNIIIIIFILLLIIFFSSFLNLKNKNIINNIEEFIDSGIKVLYVSKEDNFSKYPMELLKKYDIDCLYVNINKLSNLEKNKLSKLINSKYLSNIVVIFINGEIIDAIIEYEDEEELNQFFQKNDLIPEIIGNNSNILESVNKLLDTDYTLIYLPYKNTESVDEQNKILKDIASDYNFDYLKYDAFLLSNNQKRNLNSILQISEVEDQIIILVKDKKIIGSVRGNNNKKEYLTKFTEFKFIEEVNSSILNIDIDELNGLLNNEELNIILIGKDECKYCDEVYETLNNISINYDVKINYINIGKFDSNVSKEVELILNELGYEDGFTTPTTLIINDKKLLDYIIGASNEEYFLDIFVENGIIK